MTMKTLSSRTISLFVLLSAITGLAYPWPRHRRHCRGSLPGTGQPTAGPPGWQARRIELLARTSVTRSTSGETAPPPPQPYNAAASSGFNQGLSTRPWWTMVKVRVEALRAARAEQYGADTRGPG
jgi:K+-transporting ATPase ATPase C chain